ncbi:DUF4390 domain-containing protein [Neisseria animalis]|uniref:DUF4390 domain-containing protein n=1 Tax=Neisseria animalis TaxID=492 RepID=A0A5P3MTF6_NEIAN|nr:DUF4390 domain-containing protein [Neisseria animalis]QEY23929.1 DUF4390 domain-containing protein [Neisseria animalis]ROW31479.1 DUF4390 domain-containing protein [Neisseria animalis]VEE05888.1 Uncharacterised protein [Neisseria animalis]
MAFITRLSESCNAVFRLDKIRTVFLQTAFAATLLLSVPTAWAEGIDATRSEARLTGSGQLSVSSRFRTDLPDQLKQALKQGVPLNFALTWQLSAPALASYKFKFSQLVSDDNTIQYKLSFHPLTNRYRVSVGTFSTEYDTLPAALRAVGAVANWKVLGKGDLKGIQPRDIKAEIRLQLSTAKLPKPFQVNALTSKNWQLDSGWESLDIRRE